MPTYSIEGPDGKTYSIEGPPNATREQIIAAIKRRVPELANFQAQTPEPKEPGVFDEGGVLKEFGEGVVGGVFEAVGGVAETGAALVDLAADTNYSREVTNVKNKIKREMGIDPTGLAGEITQAVVQFAVPGLGAAGFASKLAKARNFNKNLDRLTQIGAAGFADAVVSTDGTTTIGDFVKGGPTVTSKDIGQTGREEAKRRLANKFKFGLEAAGATAAIEPALKALGVGAQVTGVAPVVSEGLDRLATSGAHLASKTGSATGQAVTKIANKVGVEEETLDRLAGFFRSRGSLPQPVFEVASGISGKVEAQLNEAGFTIKRMQKLVDKAFKKKDAVDITINGSRLDRVQSMNMLHGYLTKDSAFIDNVRIEANRLGFNTSNPNSADFIDLNDDAILAKFLPDFMQKEALEMRGQIAGLVTSIKESDLLRSGLVPEVEAAITDNIGTYLRRKYEAFENGDWFNSEIFKNAKKDAVTFYRANTEEAKDLYSILNPTTPLPEDFIVNGRVKDSYAKEIVDQFEAKYKNPGRISRSMGQNVLIAKNRIRSAMFGKKQIEQPVLRAMLGEVKDPFESYLATVADLAEFKVTNDYYDYVARNFIDEGDDFISAEAVANMSEAQREALKSTHKQLGSGTDLQFGMLTGTYAKNDVYESMHTLTAGRGGTLDFPRELYGSFLKAKGVTQYSKTVLSPITQIRNVLSASLFALAQGNIGRGSADLGTSVATVFNNIFKIDPKNRLNFFRRLQELGVVGTQTQIKELEKILEDGLGGTLKGDLDGLGVNVVREKGTFRHLLSRSRMGAFLDSAIVAPSKKAGTFARDMYQGGDDVWKIYNFMFERGKLVSAMGEQQANRYAMEMGFESLDEYAADIVKNTVPNYERVPEIIKQARKLPVGNFIAFPAEIIRTSGNTLKYAIREMQSSDPAIRAIGRRRALGFTATAGLAGTATQKLAMYLTGTNQDQVDALNRTAPGWSRNSTLLPFEVDKKGNPKSYIDFSFINPYDYWQRVFNSVLNADSKGELMNYDADTVVFNAGKEVLKEMFGPFVEYSMLTEKIIDITRGETADGRRIYNTDEGVFKGDDGPTKVSKMAAHVLDAFVPGAAEQIVGTIGPQPEKGSEIGFVPSRLAVAMSEEGKDVRGNERKISREIASFVTGARPIDVNAENIMRYGSLEYSDALRKSQSPFNQAMRVENKMDSENVLGAYITSNEMRFRVQSEMYRLVQDMKTLGISKSDILQAMSGRGISDPVITYNGRFTPAPISDQVLEEAILTQRKIGGTVPTRQLFKIQKELRNRRLDGESPKLTPRAFMPPADLSSFQPQEEPQSVVAAAPPTAAQTGAASAPLAAPVVNTTPPAQVSPIALGGDPRTLELARQLGRA